MRNRETLQEKTEKSTPDEYENSVNAHLEAAAKYIPTKIKTKYRMGNLSGERKTCTSENSLQKLSKKTNKHKCLKTKVGTISDCIYIKEQTEYIQNQIDKIESVEHRQSRHYSRKYTARMIN